MTRRATAAALLVVVLLAGCSLAVRDGLYDYNNTLVDARTARLERVAGAVYALKTVTMFRIAENEEPTPSIATGSAIALPGGFLLTVAHIAAQESIITMPTPFGVWVQIPAEKVEENTYLLYDGGEYKLGQPLFTDQEADIALFAIPDDLMVPTFPYAIGNSDELKIGDFVYLVGSSLDAGINAREGIVSATAGPEIIEMSGSNAKNAFMVSNGINPGDSGSPVIAIRDGQYELVGMTQGSFPRAQRMGWAIKINVIMQAIEPFIGKVRVVGDDPLQPIAGVEEG